MTSAPETAETTCYRHPREHAGVRCQRCDKLICPDCMTVAPVGFHCPDCMRTGRQRVIDARLSWGQARQPMTEALIGLNLLIYAAGLIAAKRPDLNSPLWLLQALALHGPPVASGEIHRILSHGFLHSGLLHVAMNMFVLSQLGPMIEKSVGPVRFAMLYVVSLLGGACGAMYYASFALTAGASGAISGLAGVILADERSQGRRLVDSQVFPMLGLSLLIPLFVPGISFGAHLGGFVAGYLAGAALISLPARLRQRRGVTDGLVVLVGIAAVAGTLWAAGLPMTRFTTAG